MAYPNDNIIGPLSATKIPFTNTDGTIPHQGDTLVRGPAGTFQWKSYTFAVDGGHAATVFGGNETVDGGNANG